MSNDGKNDVVGNDGFPHAAAAGGSMPPFQGRKPDKYSSPPPAPHVPRYSSPPFFQDASDSEHFSGTFPAVFSAGSELANPSVPENLVLI